MRMFTHAFNTWLVAHLLHPVIWMIVLIITNDGDWYGGGGVVFTVFFMCMVITIPALLVLFCIIRPLINSSIPVMHKFIIWIFFTLLTVVANVFVPTIFIDYRTELDMDYIIGVLKFCSPALLAVFISAVIRCRQFLKLNAEYTSEKENQQQMEGPVSKS